MSKLNGEVHVTWKQLVIFVVTVLPWAMTISVGVAIANYVNSRQDQTLEERAVVVERFVQVERDMGWVKKSQRRIEQRLFGNSVIPQDDQSQEAEEE